jgi:N6-adenosine-specific RNA methylase IME4
MSHYGLWDRDGTLPGYPVATSPSESLVRLAAGEKFGTILADPPWRFSNRTGKVAPEHKRLSRYSTMSIEEIGELPISQLVLPQSHLYLWVPNALVAEGLDVMKRWGFVYKTNLIWYKIRKDGGPDGRGVGFYFRNVTEMVLFGVRGSLRTLPPGRRQVNLFATLKREHSRKPDQLYGIIEGCSPGPFLELFARHGRANWYQWGNEVSEDGQLMLSGLDGYAATTSLIAQESVTHARKNGHAKSTMPRLLADRAQPP